MKTQKILVDKDGHIRSSDAVPQKGDCELEVSEFFIESYYQACDMWAQMQNRLNRMCEEKGRVIE